MSSPREQRTKTIDVAQLLHKAIKQLPDDERDVVLGYFVESGIGAAPPVHAAFSSVVVRDQLGSKGPVSFGTIFPGKSVGPGQQVVPVRLTETQHQRLKSWCAEHDFHMSVVIRGLIDRFLDEWDGRARSAT